MSAYKRRNNNPGVDAVGWSLSRFFRQVERRDAVSEIDSNRRNEDEATDSSPPRWSGESRVTYFCHYFEHYEVLVDVILMGIDERGEEKKKTNSRYRSKARTGLGATSYCA